MRYFFSCHNFIQFIDTIYLIFLLKLCNKGNKNLEMRQIFLNLVWNGL
jgi:hypothetical protein